MYPILYIYLSLLGWRARVFIVVECVCLCVMFYNISSNVYSHHHNVGRHVKLFGSFISFAARQQQHILNHFEPIHIHTIYRLLLLSYLHLHSTHSIDTHSQWAMTTTTTMSTQWFLFSRDFINISEKYLTRRSVCSQRNSRSTSIHNPMQPICDVDVYAVCYYSLLYFSCYFCGFSFLHDSIFGYSSWFYIISTSKYTTRSVAVRSLASLRFSNGGRSVRFSTRYSAHKPWRPKKE